MSARFYCGLVGIRAVRFRVTNRPSPGFAPGGRLRKWHRWLSDCLHMDRITDLCVMTEHQKSDGAETVTHGSSTVSSFSVPHFTPLLILTSSSFHPPPSLPLPPPLPPPLPLSFLFHRRTADMVQRRQAAKAVATATHHGPRLLSEGGGGECILCLVVGGGIRLANIIFCRAHTPHFMLTQNCCE